VEELFSNPIENAIRHSDCSNIRIRGQDQENQCVVTVEDDGCGIPEKEREKTFEKGYRKNKRPGSGLGLFMEKEIAESYDGSVEVSKSEMDGTRFDFTLKKALICTSVKHNSCLFLILHYFSLKGFGGQKLAGSRVKFEPVCGENHRTHLKYRVNGHHRPVPSIGSQGRWSKK